jgi:hypothetical protein
MVERYCCMLLLYMCRWWLMRPSSPLSPASRPSSHVDQPADSTHRRLQTPSSGHFQDTRRHSMQTGRPPTAAYTHRTLRHALCIRTKITFRISRTCESRSIAASRRRHTHARALISRSRVLVLRWAATGDWDRDCRLETAMLSSTGSSQGALS